MNIRLCLFLALAPQLLGQREDSPSPFPHLMNGYEFHSSIADAIQAGGGKKKIVVYSTVPLTMRNRVPWLIQQRVLFQHPLTKRALRGIPIVALANDRGRGKELRVPKAGICILTRDGQTVERTIDLITTDYRVVPDVLAECLVPRVVRPESGMLDVRKEVADFRGKRARLLNLIETRNSRAAEDLCRAEEKRLPDCFGPRFLRHTLRVQTIGKIYHRDLPLDRATADVVCVVRDNAGFVRALEAWGDGPIFPILFHDSHYLPLFVDAFKPARIVFVDAAAGEPRKVTGPAGYASYARAFDGSRVQDETGSVAMWKKHRSHSPGVVFTHPDSPMFAAGLALAAGHRQILAMLPPVDNPRARVPFATVLRLRQRLDQLFQTHMLDADQLYDDVDYVTFASEQPFRYRDSKSIDKTTYAVDDSIGRDRFDFPRVCVGRLLGGRAQSLYMAMCSLFLTQKKSLLFSWYEKRGGRSAYGTPKAVALLRGKVEISNVDGSSATLERWQEMFADGHNGHDLVHVNSSGGTRNWSTAKGNGSFDDLPLTVPTIVSYVHSTTLGDGYDTDTVGGRWLHNGAFSFFGSTSEPYLDAFVNVYGAYYRAIVEGQPLGMAHRMLPGQQRWRSWKLMLFGDPLLRLRFESRPRKAPPKLPGATSLGEATADNPFHLTGLRQRLFALECLALQGERDAVVAGMMPLLSASARSDLATRRAIADLVAWSCHGDKGIAHLRKWAPNVHRHRIDSTRLGYVAHGLIVRRLAELRKNLSAGGAAGELEELLIAHAGFAFSKAMYRRIGGLYKPMFAMMPGGRKLRSRVRARLKKRIRDHKALQSLVSAL